MARKRVKSKLPSIPTTILAGLVLGVIVFFVLSQVNTAGEAVHRAASSNPPVLYRTSTAAAPQAVAAAPQQTGCQTGQAKCGTRCYDTRSYACMNADKSVVCQKNTQMACGTACYFTATAVCVDSTTNMVCPTATPHKCGARCCT